MPAPPPNMQQMLKQAQKMQAQIQAAQASLVDATVEGTAGGGLVTTVVTGTGELTGLTIKPEVIAGADPDDLETLADLVLAAVRDGQRAAHEMAEERMGGVTGGLPPGLGF